MFRVYESSPKLCPVRDGIIGVTRRTLAITHDEACARKFLDKLYREAPEHFHYDEVSFAIEAIAPSVLAPRTPAFIPSTADLDSDVIPF